MLTTSVVLIVRVNYFNIIHSAWFTTLMNLETAVTRGQNKLLYCKSTRLSLESLAHARLPCTLLLLFLNSQSPYQQKAKSTANLKTRLVRGHQSYRSLLVIWPTLESENKTAISLNTKEGAATLDFDKN